MYMYAYCLAPHILAKFINTPLISIFFGFPSPYSDAFIHSALHLPDATAYVEHPIQETTQKRSQPLLRRKDLREIVEL